MPLKSTPLLFILLIIPNLAFAYTDSQLTEKYHGGLTQVQSDINSGILKCSDLPDNIIADGCPVKPGQTVAQLPTDSLSSKEASRNANEIYGITAIVITIFVIGISIKIIGFRRHSRHDDEYDTVEAAKDESDGTLPKGFPHTKKVPRKKISAMHKILLVIGIIKVKKNA